MYFTLQNITLKSLNNILPESNSKYPLMTKTHDLYLFRRLSAEVRQIIIVPVLFFLYVLGVLCQLGAVDFNNTQVSSQIYQESLSWNEIQDRNGIVYVPNAEQPLSGFIKKVYPNGQVMLLVHLSGGLVDQVSNWKENGIPVYSVELIPGSLSVNTLPESSEKLDGRKFHGISRFWFTTGQIMLETQYSYGKRNGFSRSWYENGNLKVEENYKDGLKDGNAHSWFENGKKWMDYTHWNDKRDGPLVWWYENGKKRQEGNYKGGQRFGEWNYFKDDGSILYRKTFRDGKSISTKYGEDEEDGKSE